MADAGNLMDALGQRARQVIARNALALEKASGVDDPISVRAKRWWDIPAKIDLANAIATQELARSNGAHNDAGDAMRHARWSQRTAEAAGPAFAAAAGLAHEAQDIGRDVAANIDQFNHQGEHGYRPPPSLGQTIAETLMDLHNNKEGRLAATQHRAINPAALQTAPRRVPAYTALYDAPEAGLEGLPHR